MIEWNEYIYHLLSSGKDLDNLNISLDNGRTKTQIPPLIRASIIMLDKITEHQGQFNVLVFPERIQSIFIFTLMKLFHNISSGKIQSNYDPTGFEVGQKLKVGNSIVEYLGVEERDGQTCVNIRLADLDKSSTPIRYLPIFQKVYTKRKLSKWSKYVSERKKAMAAFDADATGNEKLAYVADMKTHMDSSIFTMTSIAAAKEQLSACIIEDKKVTSIFYIAQADYEGKIRNVSPGQMAGTPAIVFASDLYAISSAAEEGHPIQSIIIDVSDSNMVMGQLDALDDLLRLNIPVVCITDMANSFDLNPFAQRAFNIWRWDNASLTNELYDAVPLSSDRKTRNCAHQSIQYIRTEGDDISEAIKRLACHRKETENQSPQMMQLFEKLNTITFNALRTIIPMSELENNIMQQSLTECEEILLGEEPYLDEKSCLDYSITIEFLKKIYTNGYSFGKCEALKRYLKENDTGTFLMVIPEKFRKTQIRDYWQRWLLQNRIKSRIIVLYPSEYYLWPAGEATTTIICGWLKRVIMRKVIYSFITSKYVVLLYDYENRWQKHDSARWSKTLDNTENKLIIERSFSTKKMAISTACFEKETVPEEPEIPDELNEIELILRENKYRQYVNRGGHTGNDMVSAIPVNFIGGYLAFYGISHKIVSATKIIMSDGDKIETKLPGELQIGDFIVVRETDHDIVREIADIILVNSGKQSLREIATKWREALQIELLFCTADEFCEKVKAAGCKKEISTIKRWIDDEDVIAPRSKEDLRILATVTENETLLEMLDAIFDAAQEVRNAHILAGRRLSQQLKMTLAKELKKHEDIDPFNLWEPIGMEIEGIGNVKVLKIIDIGTEIKINSADTNRLLEE